MSLSIQYLIAAVLLVFAVIILVRSISKSMQTTHDCPDCGVSDIAKPKIK